MGEKVIRKFDTTGGSRTYTGYNYSSYRTFVRPAWNRSYEKLSRYSSDGYGFDHPDTDHADEYREVFRKFSMPYLNPELSSWSDRYAPYIEIYDSGDVKVREK